MSPGPLSALRTALDRWSAATERGDPDELRAATRAVLAVAKELQPNPRSEAEAAVAGAIAEAVSASDDATAIAALAKIRAEHLEHVVGSDDDARVAVPVPAITGAYPPPVLRLASKGGSVLSEGSVAIVSGAGGAGKSTLVGHLALAVAMGPEVSDGRSRLSRLHGAMFDAPCGGRPVRYLSHEDEAPVVRDALLELARAIDEGEDGDAHEALKRVFVMEMLGRPIFGPTDRGSASGLYNARPGPLDGWADLARAVESVGPTLVIVDPVLAAYVGDSVSVPAVREFLGALARLARAYRFGILLIAHSTKAARKSGGPMDPGQIGGTDHWTSGVRGTLVLSNDETRAGRVLPCPKSNRGPDRLMIRLDAIPGGQRQPVGFRAADDHGWRPSPAPEKETGGSNGHARRSYAPGVA